MISRHTGIVVYGKEWFFGGDGIMHVPPVRKVFYFHYKDINDVLY